MTTTDTTDQVEAHIEDIDALLDAFASDETISLADYADGLADIHYRIGAALAAARHDLSQGRG